MIIDLKSVQDAPRHFDFALQPDWWHPEGEDDQVLGMDGPLDVRITIYRAGTKHILEGRLSGTLRVRCDRCLEPCRHDLSKEFRLFLAPPPATAESEIELEQEDLSLDFVVSDEVDLEEIVREQIYFSLPMKVLCKENCLGLCPSCGANLNLEKCGCPKGEGHPEFSKLKSLKF